MMSWTKKFKLSFQQVFSEHLLCAPKWIHYDLRVRCHLVPMLGATGEAAPLKTLLCAGLLQPTVDVFAWVEQRCFEKALQVILDCSLFENHCNIVTFFFFFLFSMSEIESRASSTLLVNYITSCEKILLWDKVSQNCPSWSPTCDPPAQLPE